MPANLNPTDLDALGVLIECMISTPPLSEHERSDLGGDASRHFGKRELHAHLAPVESDVGALIEAVSRSFSDYLTIGELPPPQQAYRLCELLHSASRQNIELTFLEGWSQHFEGRSIGGTYVKLKQRRMDLLREAPIANLLEIRSRNERWSDIAASNPSFSNARRRRRNHAR